MSRIFHLKCLSYEAMKQCKNVPFPFCTRTQTVSHGGRRQSNLQHLVQEVEVPAGALRTVLQRFAPQFLAYFWVKSCLL